uniref:Uncharacterized protein n=1 Tax=Knipowitschia caucasica TaxID=637954 RepID=A0AAV2LDU9_KNICA
MELKITATSLTLTTQSSHSHKWQVFYRKCVVMVVVAKENVPPQCLSLGTLWAVVYSVKGTKR